MAIESYKILGQSAPGATTSTDLYTVPAATQVVVSTITICNRGTADTTYRISIAPNGAAIATSQYIAYDAPIAVGEAIAYTLGITIDATDKIRVYAGTADLTFSAFGSEIA